MLPLDFWRSASQSATEKRLSSLWDQSGFLTVIEVRRHLVELEQKPENFLTRVSPQWLIWPTDPKAETDLPCEGSFFWLPVIQNHLSFADEILV